MRCYICDQEDANIPFDPLTHKSLPCSVCSKAISETLEEFEEPDEYFLHYEQ